MALVTFGSGMRVPAPAIVDMPAEGGQRARMVGGPARPHI
jgi:hypothetical protein